MKDRIITMVACMCVFCCASVYARTYDISVLKKNSHRANKGNRYYEEIEVEAKEKYLIKIGGSARSDDRSPMEIRCATVIRNVANKQTSVNDIASLTFDPINVGRAIYFVMETGTMCEFAERSKYYGDEDKDGWRIAGYIIDILQKGKVVKHFSNVSGAIGKTRLTDSTEQLKVNANGTSSSRRYLYHSGSSNYYDSFSNHTQIYATDDEGEKVDLEEVLAKYRDTKEDVASSVKNVVASDGNNNVFASEKDFRIDTFCGYEFRSKKPEAGGNKTIEMEQPFRSYTRLTPYYGKYTGCLTSIKLYSGRQFDSDSQRIAEVNGTAAVIEKKYGIQLTCNNYGYDNRYYGYFFRNSHVEIRVNAEYITIKDLDAEKEDIKAAPVDTKSGANVL